VGTVTAVAAAAAAIEAATQDGYAADEGGNEFEDENEVQQPAPGRPRQYNHNARPPPRPVRDDENVLHVYAILSICVLVLLHVNLQILLLSGGLNIVESIMLIFLQLGLV
jgi:hypothetical protein